MRQDIVNVLKTSHMDLVRALIGLPPYAVHRWHMGYLKMLAMFAFRYNLTITILSCYYGNHVSSHNMHIWCIMYVLTLFNLRLLSILYFPFISPLSPLPLSPLKFSSLFPIVLLSSP